MAKGKMLRTFAEGATDKRQIESLVKRYPDTHFAIARWAANLDPLAVIVREALVKVQRAAPFDLLSFPEDSTNRFITERGQLRVSWRDVTFLRLR